jgi:hypothetical protein
MRWLPLPIGREVSLEVKPTDRYERTVAEVISDININLGGCDAREYLDAEHRVSRRRYGCKEIGSCDRARELLRQRHNHLDGNGDGQACESLR